MRLAVSVVIALVFAGATVFAAPETGKRPSGVPVSGFLPRGAREEPVPTGDTRPDQWFRVDTEHFTVIFQQRDRATAHTVLAYADDVYRDTTRYLSYTPGERVPVVIHGQTARANGFFSPYPPHISLFVASPAGPWLGAHNESWIETVFVHELIHYLHLTRPVGFFGTASYLFGPLATSASTLFMPGWTVEGIAVHGETALAPGGRGENPFFQMQAIAPILEGRMYTYDQAAYSSVYAPRGRIYTAGYLMVDYLLREYGEDAFIELNRRFQRLPFFGMRRAIRRTTGLTGPEFFESMTWDLEKRYAWRRDLPAGRAITPNGPGDWFLPVPTDRGLVTYGRDFDRGPGLYLKTTPGGAHPREERDPRADERAPREERAPPNRYEEHRRQDEDARWYLLAPVSAAEERSWTINNAGTEAVVSVHVPALDGGGPAPATGASYADLFLLELAPDTRFADDRDRHGPVPSRRITQGKRLFSPALTPEGDRLVAIERRGSFSRLVDVDPGTGELSPLWEPSRTTLAGVTFSPDGKMLALTANHRGRQDLVVLDAHSGTVLGALPADRNGSGSSLEAYHFPRFAAGAAGMELWYGGETPVSEGDSLLALYRSAITPRSGHTEHSIEISAPSRVLRDRVGAWGGFPDPAAAKTATNQDETRTTKTHSPHDDPEGTIGEVPVIYGSYGSEGYVIKRGTGRVTTPATAREDEMGSAAGDPPSPSSRDSRYFAPEDSTPPDQLPREADIVERPYRDLPRPVLWLPQAAFTSGGDDGERVDLGIFSTAASNLGRHIVDLSLLYNPREHLPSGSLAYAYTPGITRWGLSVEQTYKTVPDGTSGTTDTDTELTTDLSVSAARPLWFDQHAGFSRMLTATAALLYRAKWYESRTNEGEHALASALRLHVRRLNTAATRDFFGATGSSMTTQLELVPEILDTDETSFETTTSGTLRVQPLRRAPGMIGAVQLVPTAYLTTSTTRDALARLPYRSGGFDDRRTAGDDPEAVSEQTDTQVAWMGRVELRAPLGRHDLAWRGLALTGTGLTAYIEQGGAMPGTPNAPDEFDIVPTASTVVGTELTLDLRFNMLPLPATLGIAVRMPHPGSPTEDALQFYFRLGGPVADTLGGPAADTLGGPAADTLGGPTHSAGHVRDARILRDSGGPGPVVQHPPATIQ